MSEVIPFDKRERNHITGQAICVDCKHEWQAVISEKNYVECDRWLQCPSCSLVRGRLKNPFDLGPDRFVCNCGNDLFQITSKFTYCPSCGHEVNVG